MMMSPAEGYKAMLYFMQYYLDNTGGDGELADIMNYAGYADEKIHRPFDSAWELYWDKAIERVQKEGPIVSNLVATRHIYQAQHNGIDFTIKELTNHTSATLYVQLPEDERLLRFTEADINHCQNKAFTYYRVPFDKWQYTGIDDPHGEMTKSLTKT